MLLAPTVRLGPALYPAQRNIMATESSDLRTTATIFDGVWRVFTDLRVTLVLMLAGAGLLVLLILLPTVMGGVGEPALRVISALLAFSLALRLALHIERAVRLRAGRYMAPDPALPAETVALDGSPDEARTRAETALNGVYDRVIVVDEALTRMGGVRRSFGVIGPILAAAGGLVILLGLLVNATWGGATRDLQLIEGAPAIGAAGEGGVSVGLTGDWTLMVERPGRAVAYFTTAPLRPALSGPYWIYPRAGGSTLQVAATDGAGQAASLLALESATDAGSLTLPFRANQTEQTFTAPDQGLAFRVVSYPALPERGVAGPVFLVEAYRQGQAEPALSELVEGRGDLMVDDTTYSLRRGRYVTADVAYAPGWPLLALGGLATLAGLAVVFFWPAEEAWIDLPRTGRRVAAVIRTSGGLTPGRAADVLTAALERANEAEGP